MSVPLSHNKWILLTQNSFGFNFIVSGFLVVCCRVYTSVLHGEVKIYGQVLVRACCFLLGKRDMFVHLKKKKMYKYLCTRFRWFELARSLVGQKFNSEIIWGWSFRVSGSVWYEMDWIFPCAGPHPYPGEINLVHMPLHWPGLSTPENVLSCWEKISKGVELGQVNSETRSSLANSKVVCPPGEPESRHAAGDEWK